MKTIITTIAATLFAANVSAAGIYQGRADGNSDLATQPVDCEVHSGQLDGFALFLLPRHVYARVCALRFQVLAVLFNKLS